MRILKVLVLILVVHLSGISTLVGQDFEVSPVVINFQVEPGGIATQKVLIRNHANKSQQFEFKLGDYVVEEDGSKKRVAAGTTKRSCADWVTINPGFLELKPNEETTINVIMTVPKSGHDTQWAIIYVQAATERTAMEVEKNVATGVLLKPRIVIFVNQSPKSNSNYSGKVQNLKEVPAKSVDMKDFEVEVVNNGDKMLESKVYLVLADIETGKEKKYTPFKKTVLPDSKNKIKLSIPKADLVEGKKYALAAVLDYGHRSALEAVQIILE